MNAIYVKNYQCLSCCLENETKTVSKAASYVFNNMGILKLAQACASRSK